MLAGLHSSALFPYTTLFRSLAAELLHQVAADVGGDGVVPGLARRELQRQPGQLADEALEVVLAVGLADLLLAVGGVDVGDRKSTRLNSSHTVTSYAGFCLQE